MMRQMIWKTPKQPKENKNLKQRVFLAEHSLFISAIKSHMSLSSLLEIKPSANSLCLPNGHRAKSRCCVLIRFKHPIERLTG